MFISRLKNLIGFIGGKASLLCTALAPHCRKAARWMVRTGKKMGAFAVRVYILPVVKVANAVLKAEGDFLSALKAALSEHKSDVKNFIAHTAPVLCAVLFISAVSLVGNTAMAIKVTYGDDVVGYVYNKEDYDKAIVRINNEIGARFGREDYLLESETALALASKEDVVDAEALYGNILSATETLKESCGIFSDGELITVCESKDVAQLVMDERLKAYRAQNEECGDIGISPNVELKEGLYPSETVQSREKAVAFGKEIPVVENIVETYNAPIKYKTVSSSSSKYVRGTSVVKVSGKEGVCKVTAKVSYVDGVEVSREELQSEVVSEPVDQVVVVGTKKPTVSKAKRVTWPLDANAYYVVTAYWGDGRNHQAIDLACDKGTAIMAAKSGTVVEVQYGHSTYGKNVVIDHGNGIKTRYAHCNSISVKEGQQVSAGEVIAAVGNTGRSSGPHLHFEYIINGTRVNPAPYLGL